MDHLVPGVWPKIYSSDTSVRKRVRIPSDWRSPSVKYESSWYWKPWFGPVPFVHQSPADQSDSQRWRDDLYSSKVLAFCQISGSQFFYQFLVWLIINVWSKNIRDVKKQNRFRFSLRTSQFFLCCNFLKICFNQQQFKDLNIKCCFLLELNSYVVLFGRRQFRLIN